MSNRRLRTVTIVVTTMKRLKTPRGLTPYEYICKTWTEQPHQFITDPTQHLGANN